MVVGWVSAPGLPTRWLTRETNGVRQFMGADNQIFPTFSEAYDYLYQNKHKFEVSQMTTFYSTYAKSSIIPSLSQPSTSSNSSQKQAKASKRGSTARVNTRKKGSEAAIEKLEELVTNKGPKSQIEALITTLKTYGWYSSPKIPGWLKLNPIRAPVMYLIFEPFFMKFVSKQAAIDCLKMKLIQGLISKEYFIKFIVADANIDHEVDCENDDDWVKDHESVPKGWKIRGSKSSPNEFELLSKENICFKNRIVPLQVMNLEAAKVVFEVHEMIELRDKLAFEGWEKHSSLPKGWKINRTAATSKFLTRNATILSDTAAIIKYVMEPINKVTFQERKTLLNALNKLFYNSTLTKLKPIILPEIISNIPKLPSGWSFEKLSEKVIKIISESGQVFFSRLQAIEFMIENDVDEDIIFGLWETLVEEDWIFGCNYVPAGWGVRKLDSNVLFLTKELAVLTSVDEALDYIENDDEYEPKDYKVLNDWKEIYISANWIEDSMLPEGWRKTELRFESDEEESQTEHFLAPNTNIFNGRVALIQQLIQDEHPVSLIYKFWTTLDTESWMLDTHQVPLGWKIRFDCELNQDEFLSPDMQVYRSKEAVCQLVKSASLPGEKVMAEHIRQWSQFKI